MALTTQERDPTRSAGAGGASQEKQAEAAPAGWLQAGAVVDERNKLAIVVYGQTNAAVPTPSENSSHHGAYLDQEIQEDPTMCKGSRHDAGAGG